MEHVKDEYAEDAAAAAEAVEAAHQEVARAKVLEGPGRINVTCRRKCWTALMHAAQRGHHSCVALLIEHGADIDVQDPLGEDCAMIASRNGHFPALMLILLAFGTGDDLGSAETQAPKFDADGGMEAR